MNWIEFLDEEIKNTEEELKQSVEENHTFMYKAKLEALKLRKEHNIKYILFDGLVNPKVSQTIANEANIDTAILYSIDGLTKKDFDNNASYVSLMEKNLETLKLVLK